MRYLVLFFGYKNRKYLGIFAISLVLFFIFNLLFSDFMSLKNSILLLSLKWIVNFILFGIMGIAVYKMFKKESKDEILTKQTLTTKTDLIIKKYKESK